jgi:hypothetical protein
VLQMLFQQILEAALTRLERDGDDVHLLRKLLELQDSLGALLTTQQASLRHEGRHERESWVLDRSPLTTQNPTFRTRGKAGVCTGGSASQRSVMGVRIGINSWTPFLGTTRGASSFTRLTEKTRTSRMFVGRSSRMSIYCETGRSDFISLCTATHCRKKLPSPGRNNDAL